MERVEEMNGIATALEGISILLLEDNAADVELLLATLLDSDLNCTFTVVDTRDAFFSVLDNQQIDVVIADYSSPTFDGLSAVEFMKSRLPNIPCILVSAVLSEDLVVEAIKSGAANYIVKQNLGRLVPAIERALREQKEKEALLSATANLRAREKRFQTSIETMADCFMMLSSVQDSEGFIQDFTVSYLNAAACEVLAVSRERYVGKSVYTVIPAFKTTARENFEGSEDFDLFLVFCGVVETGYPFMGELIFSAYQPSDQFVAIDIRIVRLDDELVVTWRDITEKKRDEQRYSQLLAAAESACNQLEKVNQFKNDFLGNLSHELRSPLSTIMRWLEVSNNYHDDEESLTKAIQTSYYNAELLAQLIEDLLDVSKLPDDGFQCNLEPLSFDNLTGLILEVVDAIAPAARNKDIEIVFSPELSTNNVRDSVLGDSTRLQRAFRNLLFNALKFTPAGGRITVSLEQTLDSIAVSVQDTGVGISSEAMPHIFERFWQGECASFTASRHSSYGGLGLGLPIVKHIVLAHNGQISANSAGPGRGSCFRVELPLASKQLLLNSASSKASATALAANVLEGCRVLIVEAYPDGLEVYVSMLEACGATVEGVQSADDALKLFQEFSPHLLISELVLPGKSGYELIREIRSFPATAGGNVLAIALTALSESSYRTRALLAGFQQHIAKPIELQEMVAVVSRLYQLAVN